MTAVGDPALSKQTNTLTYGPIMCYGMETLNTHFALLQLLCCLPAYASSWLIAVFKLWIALWDMGWSELCGRAAAGHVGTYFSVFIDLHLALALAEAGRAWC